MDKTLALIFLPNAMLRSLFVFWRLLLSTLFDWNQRKDSFQRNVLPLYRSALRRAVELTYISHHSCAVVAMSFLRSHASMLKHQQFEMLSLIKTCDKSYADC